MTRWLLQALEIEGFRGINNEGDPLTLRFGVDSVNSVSAPNGVGKSSIFEALTFALTGAIPKLEGLPAAERGGDYYNNRFHSKGVGTIKMTLAPDHGGAPIVVTAARAADGKRSVTAPLGLNGEAILAALNRDFVLLDHHTFESFIDARAVERGRSFSGLLGLARYSELRQELQALSNTRAFNNHFGVAALEQSRAQHAERLGRQNATAQSAFNALTGEALAEQGDHAIASAAAQHALEQIQVIRDQCHGKDFADISIDDCVKAIGLAEGGEERARLSEVIQLETKWKALLDGDRSADDAASLRKLAADRDAALAETSGALLHESLTAAQHVLEHDGWTDPQMCPTCGRQAEAPVIDYVRAELGKYAAVASATSAIAIEWETKNWASLLRAEDAVRNADEPALFADAQRHIGDRSLTAADVDALLTWKATVRSRIEAALAVASDERTALEQKLPPSLVAVTTKVEAGRRLQDAWREAYATRSQLAAIESNQARHSRVKAFLDVTSDRFAKAEAAASARRLAAVVPRAQGFFRSIMHEPLKPVLVKEGDGEGLAIGLAEFWSLKNVSAQALLSESYRNAFAVSVYLAAASLYGGAPLFVVLDDVTSSFDAGHQYHLMEVIRTQFARPTKADGLQVILFSHDTLLEKLFNKNVQQGGWSHQRLEGNARTAVLPQSHTANRLRDKTISLLNAGQVEDASPRVRQYLEFKLFEIIGRVRIPVPVDFALDDQKKQLQTAIDAIDAAVKLHQAAGSLILQPPQITALAPNIATITGNFLAHYATGSTHSFSAASLLGVMKAIDDYASCFMFEDPPGSGSMRYYKSLSARI